MEFVFTYAELSKKLGCTELTIRNWLKHYNVKIEEGTRGRHGTPAKVHITDATIRAIVQDSINYAKYGKKPFENFIGCDWNRLDKLEEDIPTFNPYGKDSDGVEYKLFEDNFSVKSYETVYFLVDDRVYKMKSIENDCTFSAHFRTLTDYHMSEFDSAFDRETLTDSAGRQYQPVMIRNSKGEWITHPKSKTKR